MSAQDRGAVSADGEQPGVAEGVQARRTSDQVEAQRQDGVDGRNKQQALLVARAVGEHAGPYQVGDQRPGPKRASGTPTGSRPQLQASPTAPLRSYSRARGQ